MNGKIDSVKIEVHKCVINQQTSPEIKGALSGTLVETFHETSLHSMLEMSNIKVNKKDLYQWDYAKKWRSYHQSIQTVRIKSP